MAFPVSERSSVPADNGRVLRSILQSAAPAVIVEAHDALSACIAERAGIPAVWASSLTISATWGVRDANELTWTQVAEVLEHMVDATSIPVLVDGDSGHGDFNTVRRFVRHLSARGVAGVCFEDQCFPKRNSLVGGDHALATVEEFCGKLHAAKEAQQDDGFVVVARVEALIAGLGMDEALRRADAYRRAGADAVLIHSRRSDASEVLAFAREWAGRTPLLIVPTTYSATPVSAYVDTGISALIWANHALRGAITGMRRVYETIRLHGTPHTLESAIAPVADVFDLTRFDDLAAMRSQLARRVADALATRGAPTAAPVA
jgi:phosphoenolpyruvate phosphomutase